MLNPAPPFEIALLIVIGFLIALAAVAYIVRRIARRLRQKYGNS